MNSQQRLQKFVVQTNVGLSIFLTIHYSQQFGGENIPKHNTVKFRY